MPANGRRHPAVTLIAHAYADDVAITGPNGSCLIAAGSPTDTDDCQKFRNLSTRQIAFLVAERSMPARLHRHLLQCAKMNPGPVSTATHTNCLRLMQWNANGISGKVTELLTFLHGNSVNIAATQETNLTNKTMPHITTGRAAVQLDRHKSKDSVLLMLIKDMMSNVDNTAALHQSADPDLEQHGISIAIPYRQQLHIHNMDIPPRSSCSAGHNASTALLLCNSEMSHIVGDINTHISRWNTSTKDEERGERLADKIDAADYIMLN